LEAPTSDPVSSQPKTAQRILVAARGLVIEGGYESVTLEKAAAGAGVDEVSSRCDFGNKSELAAADRDSLTHDEYLGSFNRMKDVDPGDRF
jgi:AcrR family transcriptional regulator